MRQLLLCIIDKTMIDKEKEIELLDEDFDSDDDIEDFDDYDDQDESY